MKIYPLLLKFVLPFFFGFFLCFFLLLMEPVKAIIYSQSVMNSISFSQPAPQKLLPDNGSLKKIDQPILISSLVDTMRVSEENMRNDFKNYQSVKFSTGTNYPISTKELPDEGQLANNNFKAMGGLNRKGQLRPITTGLILKMVGSLIAINEANKHTDKLIKNDGPLGDLGRIILRETNKKLIQGITGTSFNLVLLNNAEQKFYLAEATNPNALLRDAINSSVNRTMEPRNFKEEVQYPEAKISPYL